MLPLDHPSEITNQSIAPIDETRKGGRVVGSSNIHSKQPSSIATRMKALGIDWVESFAVAIKRNDKQLLSLWLRLLPYLIVTGGHRRVKRLDRMKGKASKAALAALDALEDRG